MSICKSWIFAAFLAGLFATHALRAEGVFIPAPNRVDIAYDDIRGVLYISSGSQLLRYQIASSSFLTPIDLGGTLGGMDISADGAALVVADNSYTTGSVWIHIVNLVTLATQKITFPQALSEAGTFTAAYASDGSILVSSKYAGSGPVPLRRYVPSTGVTTQLASIQQNSMLRANADHGVIAVAEWNISSGPFDRYRVSDGNFLRSPIGTSVLNSEIAVRPDGQQYIIPAFSGAFVIDGSLNIQPTRIGNSSNGPLNVTYHPVKNLVYFPFRNVATIFVYDSTTLTQIGSYDFESSFGINTNAFANGRVKTSQDGSLLFATVTGGVRYVTTDAVAPKGLTAIGREASVDLSWTASSNGTRYLVYQGTSANGESMTLVRTGITATSVTIDGLTNGVTYYFRVAAETPVGTSTPSSAANAKPIGVPTVVTGFGATARNGSVNLVWEAVAGADSYIIYQGTSSGNLAAVATGLTGTSYIANAVTNGVTYYFQVAASNSAGAGPRSIELAATPVPPPVAPSALTATVGNTSVQLSWSGSTYATQYFVYMGSGAGFQAAQPVATVGGTSTTVSGLTNGTEYYFKVVAQNVSGLSPLSNEIAATPVAAPPTATPASNDKGSGGGAFESYALLVLSAFGVLRRAVRRKST